MGAPGRRVRRPTRAWPLRASRAVHTRAGFPDGGEGPSVLSRGLELVLTKTHGSWGWRSGALGRRSFASSLGRRGGGFRGSEVAGLCRWCVLAPFWLEGAGLERRKLLRGASRRGCGGEQERGAGDRPGRKEALPVSGRGTLLGGDPGRDAGQEAGSGPPRPPRRGCRSAGLVKSAGCLE